MFAFLRNLFSAKPSVDVYVRSEPAEWASTYAPPNGYLPVLPPGVAEIAGAVAQSVGRATRDADFPVTAEALSTAAAAFCRVASAVTGVPLDLGAPNAAQFDAVADHFIDPALRPYFAGGRLRSDLTAAEQDAWRAMGASARVPDAPDLYYGFGAACGEWLVRHRHSVWGLLGPLRPMQFFPDAAAAGHTMSALPFSFVSKRLADPEGDNLNFKMDDPPMRDRIPPFPLIASLADTREAWFRTFPPEARPLLISEASAPPERTLAGYMRLLRRHPEHTGLLSVAGELARTQVDPYLAVTLLRRLSPLAPDVSRVHLTLAMLLVSAPNPKYANEITEHVRAAIRLEPNEPALRSFLATHLARAGDAEGARECLRWLVEHDRDQAAETIEECRKLGVVLET